LHFIVFKILIKILILLNMLNSDFDNNEMNQTNLIKITKSGFDFAHSENSSGPALPVEVPVVNCFRYMFSGNII
jgi:hypothetical protein